MTDKEALQLHDRAARGETLTDEQRARLEAWYAIQDAAESRELAAAVDSADLTRRIQASLDQVTETARRIQRTMRENDSLRREIASLRLELSQQTASSG